MGEDAHDLGEFGLIERLLGRLDRPGKGVVIGPGDDAAVVDPRGAAILTTDLLLEGVHFELGLSSPADVGYKALAASLSDVAAMGGIPTFALVGLGAPASFPAATLESLYEGLGECARAFGVAVVGGDMVRAESLVVSVVVTGAVGEHGVVTRGGARAEQVVCVTGSLGGAAAGLALLKAQEDPEAAALLARYPGLAAAHRRPMPRVREGLAAASAGATAMIDLSDGLAADVSHLCDASGIGVELRAVSIPVAEGVAEVASWADRDPLELVLGGGEDYELAIAIPAARVEFLAGALAPTQVTSVGVFGEGERVLIEGDSSRRSLDGLGWDHFRRQRGDV